MSSVYLSAALKSRLIQAARRRGFAVERGRQSQLMEYIAYLVTLDEKAETTHPRRTLSKALGLLACSGEEPPSDVQIEQILAERRLRH